MKTIVTLRITQAQTEVFSNLIVNTPWFRTKAKHCTFATSGARQGAEVAFDYEADFADLMDMLSVANRFGYNYRTCLALENRVQAARDHAVATAKKAA
jgi:hypothetical protein